MGKRSKGFDGLTGELTVTARESLAPVAESTSRVPLPHHKDRLSQKSAVLLRVLRQKARATRNKKPKEFYSIREVAGHFGVPLTTVSRVYSQLRAEGLLTTVWGSKTFIAPTAIDKDLRIRGVVALPAALVSFCAVRQYRNFFSEIRDALWKFGFATRLLLYEENEVELPIFAERLLNHSVDIVVWFLPTPRSKQTVARLFDRGINVIAVTDSAEDCHGHCYCVDRKPPIRDALLSWRKHGISSVAVFQHSPCRPSGILTLLEKCLRDAAMPYSFVNAESVHLEKIFAPRVQQVTPGIIFPCSDMAVPFAVRDPDRFAKLSERSRILLVDGAIDIAGSYAVPGSIDIIEIDSQPIAARIVSDLVQSARPRKTEPLMLQAKWIPASNRFPNARGNGQGL